MIKCVCSVNDHTVGIFSDSIARKLSASSLAATVQQSVKECKSLYHAILMWEETYNLQC